MDKPSMEKSSMKNRRNTSISNTGGRDFTIWRINLVHKSHTDTLSATHHYALIIHITLDMETFYELTDVQLYA